MAGKRPAIEAAFEIEPGDRRRELALAGAGLPATYHLFEGGEGYLYRLVADGEGKVSFTFGAKGHGLLVATRTDLVEVYGKVLRTRTHARPQTGQA